MNLKLQGLVPSLIIYIPIPNGQLTTLGLSYRQIFHICIPSAVEQSAMSRLRRCNEDDKWRITTIHFD